MIKSIGVCASPGSVQLHCVKVCQSVKARIEVPTQDSLASNPGYPPKSFRILPPLRDRWEDIKINCPPDSTAVHLLAVPSLMCDDCKSLGMNSVCTNIHTIRYFGTFLQQQNIPRCEHRNLGQKCLLNPLTVQPRSSSTLSESEGVSHLLTVPSRFRSTKLLPSDIACNVHACLHLHDDSEPSSPSMPSDILMSFSVDSFSTASWIFHFFQKSPTRFGPLP